MKQARPVIHGGDHRAGGADPIPSRWRLVGSSDVDPWTGTTDPAFQNGVTNSGGGKQELRFRDSGFSAVDFDGVVSVPVDPTLPLLVTTIPAAYSLPDETIFMSGVGLYDWQFDPDGSLSLIAKGSTVPTGTAGGSLTGTYPNPTLAADSVGAAELADDSVDTAAIQDGAVTDAKITGPLSANARVGVRKNSTGSTFLRRRINLIEGSNVTLTVADDATDEEVDVTIAAAGGGGGASALDDLSDVTITSPTNGEVLTYDSGSGQWIDAAPTTGAAVVATTIAGLGTPSAGVTGLIRAGSTPYDFLAVVYDATYGKWVSAESQALRALNANMTTSSTSYVGVGGSNVTYGFIPWKTFDTAGLTLQFRVLALMSCSGGATASLGIITQGYDAGGALQNLVTTEFCVVTTTSASLVGLDSGWVDHGNAATVRDVLAPHGRFKCSSGAQTATVGRFELHYRWVG